MKPDIPITAAQFFAAAEGRGFGVVRDVSVQRLTVASLERNGPVLRFFAPDLRTLPEGTQVNGSVGVAVIGTDGRYEQAVFHHILNLTELREADRLIRQNSDWATFFRVLLPALEALPSTPQALAEAIADSASWMGKQLSWGDANAVSFAQRVRELALN